MSMNYNKFEVNKYSKIYYDISMGYSKIIFFFFFQTFTSSQSWAQSSPRQNGEVPKSTEAKSSQNSHEMSTEL